MYRLNYKTSGLHKETATMTFAHSDEILFTLTVRPCDTDLLLGRAIMLASDLLDDDDDDIEICNLDKLHKLN